MTHKNGFTATVFAAVVTASMMMVVTPTMGAEPTIFASNPPPESRQAAATALYPLDQDSGFRLTQSERLNFVAMLAFGAGVAVMLLMKALVEFMRDVFRRLDEFLLILQRYEAQPHVG